jgi:hypothetical protein
VDTSSPRLACCLVTARFTWVFTPDTVALGDSGGDGELS